VNVDAVPETSPDVVHDLNIRPWPFATSEFMEVVGHDVLEHIRDVVAFMEELHRVAAPAIVRLTPHFSCANAWAIRPTSGVCSRQPDYFTASHAFSFYSSARFRRMAAQLNFAFLMNRLVWRVPNRWPRRETEGIFPGGLFALNSKGQVTICSLAFIRDVGMREFHEVRILVATLN
jgi:hypothetical protein